MRAYRDGEFLVAVEGYTRTNLPQLIHWIVVKCLSLGNWRADFLMMNEHTGGDVSLRC